MFPKVSRRDITSAFISEIPGKDKDPGADALASRMRDLFANTPGTWISRPIWSLRITGFDSENDSVVPEEIRGVY